MIDDTPSFAGLFIPSMGRATKYVSILMNGRLSKIDLTLKQFVLLVHIKEEGREQSELAIITERDKGSLTRLIQSMERKGFVKRSVSKTDRRVNIVESTALGRGALKKAEKIVLKTFDELRTDISPKEEKLMIKITSKLMENACRLSEHARTKKL